MYDNPNDQKRTIETVTPAPVQKFGKRRHVLVVVLLLFSTVLFAGAAAYLYWDKLQSETPAVVEEAIVSDDKTDGSAATVEHVLAVGYPLNSGKKIAVDLGLPSFMNGVSVRSDNQNRGLERWFTTSYNNEIGRWEVGYPKFADSSTNLSIVYIDEEWLTGSEEGLMLSPPSAESLATPNDRAEFLAKVKNRTKDCAEGAKFQMQGDVVFDVCYELKSVPDSLRPTLGVEGYAEIDGHPLYLAGFFELLSDENVNANTPLGADPEYPAYYNDLVQQIVAALAQTKIAMDDNDR